MIEESEFPLINNTRLFRDIFHDYSNYIFS